MEIIYQNFADKCQNLVEEMLDEVHTAMPGKILSFNPKTGLAVVLPQVKMNNGTNNLAYPAIYNVPIALSQGCLQKTTIAYPVKEGDGCLLIISEQVLDYWLYGQESENSGALRFDLASAIAILGLMPTPNQILERACQENALIIAHEEQEIKLKSDGVEIKGDLRVLGKIEATGDIVAKHNEADAYVSLLSHKQESGGSPYMEDWS